MNRRRIVLYYPKFPQDRHLKGDAYFPPYSLLMVAASAAAAGHDVEIVDGRIAGKPPLDGDYLGISALTGSQILDALKVVRDYHGIKIWGGWHPTVCPEQTAAHPQVDLVVRGQGEQTLAEILNGIRFEEILGLTYKTPEGVKNNPDRPLIAIDKLPRPVWDMVDMENYIVKTADVGRRTWYYASQGCPYRCSYCCIGSVTPAISLLPPKTVGKEMRELKERYGVDTVYLADNTFLINTGYGLKVAEQMHSVGLRWEFQTRVNLVNAMTDGQLQKFKDLGVRHIDLGIEAGCDAILGRMRKGITAGQSLRAAERLVKLGFSVGAYFIIGTPFETKEQTLETFGFLEKLPPEAVKNVNYYTPYPQTDLYDLALKEGFIPPSTLEGWGYHTINDRLPPDPDVRRLYRSYRGQKPRISIRRMNRAVRYVSSEIKSRASLLFADAS